MIVAMVLSAQAPYVTVAASVAGILSKYVVRSRAGNLFNRPLGIVVLVRCSRGTELVGRDAGSTALAQADVASRGVFIGTRQQAAAGGRLPRRLLRALHRERVRRTTGGVSEVFRNPDLQARLTSPSHPHDPPNVSRQHHDS